MRLRFALLAAAFAAACTTAPVAPAPQTSASDPHEASRDATLEVLLTSCATDFHDHSPPTPTAFRHVRLGHIAGPGRPMYLLCGEFLPQQPDGKAEWTQFSTVKTSGYEQMLGSTSLCEPSRFTWDSDNDFSAELQKRFDLLK